MKTLLIFPPQWNPFHVYPSLPSLQNYLKQKGESPSLCDANIEFYNFLNTPDFRTIGINRAERRLEEISLDDERRAEIASARAILLRGEEFALTIESIREQRVFEDIYKRRQVFAAWDTYLDAVSTLYPPLKLTYRGLKMLDLNVNLESILRFCESGEDNLFTVYFTHSLRKRLQAIAPDIVGLSVIGLEQVIPSLTLCRFLKSEFPRVHVTIGGGVFTAYLDATNEYDSIIGTLLDSIIIGNGGEPLYRLIEGLRNQTSLSGIPNLVFKSETGTISRNVVPEQHGSALPPPDYSGLDLSAYFHYDPAKSPQ